jgi:hypothetical protein
MSRKKTLPPPTTSSPQKKGMLSSGWYYTRSPIPTHSTRQIYLPTPKQKNVNTCNNKEKKKK